MKVLLTAVEAIPFAKTGNLSEITGTLPLYLKDLGIDVRIIMPFHSSVTKTKVNFQDLGRITATINDKNINATLDHLGEHTQPCLAALPSSPA